MKNCFVKDFKTFDQIFQENVFFLFQKNISKILHLKISLPSPKKSSENMWCNVFPQSFFNGRKTNRGSYISVWTLLLSKLCFKKFKTFCFIHKISGILVILYVNKKKHLYIRSIYLEWQRNTTLLFLTSFEDYFSKN